MFLPLSIHLFSVGLLQSWQGKVDSCHTGCVRSILWSQSTLHWSLYLRGVLSKQIFTSATFWKWTVLKILFSKAVSLWPIQARKASYFLKTQKDFGPESKYDSVEKLLLDVNCHSFVFSREKLELWKLASDFKSFKKGEHIYSSQISIWLFSIF